jgi:hypothetical protein
MTSYTCDKLSKWFDEGTRFDCSNTGSVTAGKTCVAMEESRGESELVLMEGISKEVDGKIDSRW